MTRMIDIGGKRVVKRTAVAEGYLVLKESTLKTIVKNDVKKGDVFSASKLAGIQAAKATSTILPLCHQIPLTSVELDISVLKGKVRARCTVSAEYKTGVEMEALVGVAASLLNVWDMVKYLEKNERGQYPTARMMDVCVLRKTKGGSRE